MLHGFIVRADLDVVDGEDLLDVPILFDRPFIDLSEEAPRSSKDELQRLVDAYDACKEAEARGEGDAWQMMEAKLEEGLQTPRPQANWPDATDLMEQVREKARKSVADKEGL